MKWFGKSWGAPVCDYAEWCVTPIGEPCLDCQKRITEHDCGFVVPLIESVDWNTEMARVSLRCYHRACFVKNVLGPAKIQNEEKSNNESASEDVQQQR